MTTPGGSGAYRIEVRGRLSDEILGPYASEFVVSRTSDRTVLTGPVRDAAHLHGIVAHLTSLGLELVGVTEIADAAGGAGATDIAPTPTGEG